MPMERQRMTSYSEEASKCMPKLAMILRTARCGLALTAYLALKPYACGKFNTSCIRCSSKALE